MKSLEPPLVSILELDFTFWDKINFKSITSPCTSFATRILLNLILIDSRSILSYLRAGELAKGPFSIFKLQDNLTLIHKNMQNETLNEGVVKERCFGAPEQTKLVLLHGLQT